MTSPASVTYLETRVTLSCMLCTRTVASAHGTRVKVARMVRIAKRQLACPYCGGALWVSDIEETAPVDRSPLTGEDLHPKRGRPPLKRGAA